MRLTTLTDYAMRLLIYVGQNPDRLCTIAEIAQAHGISEPHLMKVTHRLAQTGWLETVRGKNGGMRLSRPPAQIRLGDVIRDTENDLSLVECFAGHSNCVLLGSCRLAGVLSGALDQFMNYLDQFTLADILPFDALTMPPTTPGSGDIPPDSAGRGRDGFVRIVPHKVAPDPDQTGSA